MKGLVKFSYMANNVETVFVDVHTSIEDTWKYYTEIEHIKNWCFMVNGWELKEASAELFPGGNFRFFIEKKDGDCSIDFKGVYKEIIPNKFLSFTVMDMYNFSLEFNESIKGTIIIQVIEKTEKFDLTTLNFWKQVMKSFKRYCRQPSTNK